MRTETQKVLIVDDEAALRRSLHFALHQRGFQTDEVEEALPALRLIESSFAEGKPYNFIIADINLPDINGLKLLEVIKSKYPNLPVIVISAYGTETTEDAVTIKKGDGYLEKPFMVDELTHVIEQIPARPVEPAPGAALQPTSVSTYAMVKLRPDCDVMAAYSDMYFMDNVVYCDAVHGDYDLVLLLNAPTEQEIDTIIRSKIHGHPSVADVEFNSVVRPVLEPGIWDFIKDYDRNMNRERNRVGEASSAISAYLFVEIQPERFGDAFPKLYFMNGVVSCDATRGRYDAVALVQGHNFKEIERILTEDVARIEGIVRARSVKIINMFEM